MWTVVTRWLTFAVFPVPTHSFMDPHPLPEPPEGLGKARPPVVGTFLQATCLGGGGTKAGSSGSLTSALCTGLLLPLSGPFM